MFRTLHIFVCFSFLNLSFFLCLVSHLSSVSCYTIFFGSFGSFCWFSPFLFYNPIITFFLLFSFLLPSVTLSAFFSSSDSLLFTPYIALFRSFWLLPPFIAPYTPPLVLFSVYNIGQMSAFLHPLSSLQRLVFLLNSRCPPFPLPFPVHLLPKLQCHFAEFLTMSSASIFTFLCLSTCVGLITALSNAALSCFFRCHPAFFPIIFPLSGSS